MNGNGRMVKVIGLVFTGSMIIGGTVASAYKAISSAKEYTDENIRYLREEQEEKTEKIQDDVTKIREDMAVVRTIVEQKLGRPSLR